MKRYTIQYIPQSNFYACDQACLAMVAGIGIEEAMSVMGDKKGVGSAAMYKAFKKYNIGYTSWRKVASIDDLPPLCILGVKFPEYGHSVLFYNGVFYDPEFGVMTTYTPNGQIENYIELFIDDAYKGLTPKVKLPADFQSAFENDLEAFNIFNQLSYPEKSKFINKISHYKDPMVRKGNIVKLLNLLKKRI
jgi:hypothetical protein